MRLPILWALCAALLVACVLRVSADGVAVAPAFADPPRDVPRDGRESRLRAFAAEYVLPATPEARRAVLAAEFAREDAAEPRPGGVSGVVRVVRDALQTEARRGIALDLAVLLRSAAVFPAAKRYADGPCAARVAVLAAVCDDEDAAAWLVARWRTADPASDAFRHAEAALAGHVLSAVTVDAVGTALRDESRAASAVAILRPQLGLAGDVTAADLASRWTGLRAMHAAEAAVFADRGALTLLPPRPRDGEGWRLHGAVAVGPNLRVPAGRCLDLAALPRTARDDDGALRLRVRANDATGAEVSFVCDDGRQSLNIRCDGKVWFLVEGPPRAGDRVEAPSRPGEWTEFIVRVRDPRIDGQPGLRDVRVWCGGVEMRPGGGFWRMPSAFASLSVRAPGGEPCVVGGVTWTPCAR